MAIFFPIYALSRCCKRKNKKHVQEHCAQECAAANQNQLASRPKSNRSDVLSEEGMLGLADDWYRNLEFDIPLAKMRTNRKIDRAAINNV